MKFLKLVFLALCLSLGSAAPKKKATDDKSDLIPIPDHLMEDYHQPSGTLIDNFEDFRVWFSDQIPLIFYGSLKYLSMSLLSKIPISQNFDIFMPHFHNGKLTFWLKVLLKTIAIHQCCGQVFF